MAVEPPFQCQRTFAEFLASDDELMIFRRFDGLNARNLLQLQSELIALEAELKTLDEQDFADAKNGDDGLDVQLAARCWETMSSRAEERPREAERMGLMKRIEHAVERYNNALIARSRILQLRGPEHRPSKVYREWFANARPFVGHSKDLPSQERSFVALHAPAENDKISSLLKDLVGYYFERKVNKDGQGGLVYYSEQSINRLVTLVVVIGATLLLEVAIVALYLVTNEHVRLGLCGVFTAIFAAAVSLLSNARRAELFGATAAYAAVLVVFLSGDFRPGSETSRQQ